eukprot:5737857-Amphidinium_carterae.1
MMMQQGGKPGNWGNQSKKISAFQGWRTANQVRSKQQFDKIGVCGAHAAQTDTCCRGQPRIDRVVGDWTRQGFVEDKAGITAEGSASHAFGRNQTTGGEGRRPSSSRRRSPAETH